ncbi:hypothetical protein JOD66_005254 [Nocardioides nitrophenolicus]|nr:hypothetical protein [Nocardioides nitrophenolicus]
MRPTSTPPTTEPSCRCHPCYHDLGVHAPGYDAGVK